MEDDLIVIEHLTKRFPKTREDAIHDITLRIPRRGIVGLVGPDGAGKTTLIRLMASLLLPTTGAITVDGHDTVKEASKIFSLIGYMPQRFGLYEDLTVIQNMTLYADLQGVIGPERETTFKRLLDFTNLNEFTKRKAKALSGGMKQKLGLACSLLRKPPLLLLDEPSVGVDPISRRELWKMVRGLIEEGITVRLWWDATTPTLIATLNGSGGSTYKQFGGLQNTAGATGYTGKITFTTEGWASSAVDNFTFVLELVKIGC